MWYLIIVIKRKMVDKVMYDLRMMDVIEDLLIMFWKNSFVLISMRIIFKRVKENLKLMMIVL